ncbi:YggT family protein [Bartonella krasnovii]|uniref:YggT family protein n=1 Tax=Bartonella krasnovii TaxID=2267275 RepID=A0A5B9D086_9HYPH|nr:YggT family protein [Bartonella krasnovii]QEE11501.1 YggT family protein [Bartonella krasnovii]UNF29256.1 YggT family protein [Bartonella krasnovii]UNF35613.1 YggT family protein [Bartonella krasnovii]UNF37233.1 YggT family protein [Bartonella krasnovii]UNF38927.1 YggT family protein [Bartonella krasnovii]
MVYALLQTLDLIFNLYIYILIASVVFSWLYVFNIINPRNRFVVLIGSFLYRLTNPILNPIRQILPNLGTIDISPMVVFIIIYFIRNFMWRAYINMYL